MVDTVLLRDKNWVRWKLQQCPEITRTPVSADQCQQAMSGMESSCTTRTLQAKAIGSLDLAFLIDSDAEGGLEVMKSYDK
jgi:THO complex subunit 1